MGMTMPHYPNIMKPIVKVGLVVAGYVIAVAMATAAVVCHLIVLGGPAGSAGGGMNAFGDGLLFLAIFGVAAVPPTVAAFFFLRPYPAFWRGFSVMALVFACTSLTIFIPVAVDSRSAVVDWIFLRVLVSPLFALVFGLSIFFAPTRAFRIALLIATVMEAAGFAGWVITCFLRNP
jgi:hypothetical protein